jgi:hypothetical protein
MEPGCEAQPLKETTSPPRLQTPQTESDSHFSTASATITAISTQL